MSKTKEIQVNGSAARIDANTHKLVAVTIEDPDIDELLGSIHETDYIRYVKDNHLPEDVYDGEQLEKWAEANGYAKT